MRSTKWDQQRGYIELGSKRINYKIDNKGSTTTESKTMSFRTAKDIEESNKGKLKHTTKDLEDIKHDYQIVLQGFLDRILDKVERQIRWNTDHKDRALSEVVLVRYMDITGWYDTEQMKTNIKPTTFFTGFWDKNTHEFNYVTFTEAEIEKMIFEKATEILKEYKYALEDISDAEKSKKKVCKISWKIED